MKKNKENVKLGLIKKLVLELKYSTMISNRFNLYLADCKKFRNFNLTNLMNLLTIYEKPGLSTYKLAMYFNTTPQRVRYSVNILKSDELIYLKGEIEDNRYRNSLYITEKGINFLNGLYYYFLYKESKDCCIDVNNINEEFHSVANFNKFFDSFIAFKKKIAEDERYINN